MKENKLYIIINTLDKGGAERIASEFSYHLDKKGYLPVFLLTDKAPVQYKIPLNAKVIFLPLSRYIRGVFFPFIILIQGVYIRIKFGNDFKAISFLHRANLVNGIAGFFSKRKIIVSERSLFTKSYSGFKYYLLKALLKLLFYRVDKVIAISEVVETELKSVFKIKQEKVIVIHNPINTNQFNFSKNINNFISKKDELRFCAVCRLIKSKRVNIIINLFKEILKYKPKSEFHIIGGGNEMANLVRQTIDLNINDKVIFHGQVDEVVSILKSCDVFLFSSFYESFGNVALEATSIGLPVVYTSNLETFKEIYNMDPNLSFPFREDFMIDDVQSILMYLDNIQYLEFKIAREKFLKRYSSNEIFERYLNELKA